MPAKTPQRPRLAITVNQIGLFAGTPTDRERGWEHVIRAINASPLVLHEAELALSEAISEGLEGVATAAFLAPNVAKEIAELRQLPKDQLPFIERAFLCGQRLAFLRLIAGNVTSHIYRYKSVKRRQSEGGKSSKKNSDAKWKPIKQRFLAECRKKPSRTKDDICQALSVEFKLSVETLKGRLRVPKTKSKGERATKNAAAPKSQTGV